jgi:hypothetical protein
VVHGRERSRGRFLVRPPDTMAALMPCVGFSTLLKEDLHRAKQEDGAEGRIAKLEGLSRRCGLSIFKDST